MCSFKISLFNKFFIENVWLHITHTALIFFHGGSCSCILLKFIFTTYVTFFFQMFHINMLQHLFWASLAFSLFTFIVWKTFFMLFSNNFFIVQIYLHNSFSSQHQCIASNCQPHNLKGINDRLIHMLLSYKLFHNFMILDAFILACFLIVL